MKIRKIWAHCIHIIYAVHRLVILQKPDIFADKLLDQKFCCQKPTTSLTTTVWIKVVACVKYSRSFRGGTKFHFKINSENSPHKIDSSRK